MKISGIILCCILCLPLVPETRGSLRVETEKYGNEDTSSILIIGTDIPKTEVYLNGRYRGLTPHAEKRIAPGFWRIGLKNDGYYPESFLIQVEPGERKKVYVELLPKDVGSDVDRANTDAENPANTGPEAGKN